MSFAKFISKKQGSATVFLALLIALVPSQLYAQQQTGQAVPETRNPQNNAPQLFQQQTDVQPTSPQQLLNQSFKIEIPKGVPIKSNERVLTPTRGRGKQVFLLALGALAVAGSVVLLRRAQRQTTHIPANDFTGATLVASQTAPQANKSVKQHKSSKKKKHKGKPRKKH